MRPVAAPPVRSCADVLGGGFRMDQQGNGGYNVHIKHLEPISATDAPLDPQLLAALANEQVARTVPAHVQNGPYVYNNVLPERNVQRHAASSAGQSLVATHVGSNAEPVALLCTGSLRHARQEFGLTHVTARQKAGNPPPWAAGPGLRGRRVQQQQPFESHPRRCIQGMHGQQDHSKPSAMLKYQVLTGAQLARNQAIAAEQAAQTLALQTTGTLLQQQKAEEGTHSALRVDEPRSASATKYPAGSTSIHTTLQAPGELAVCSSAVTPLQTSHTTSQAAGEVSTSEALQAPEQVPDTAIAATASSACMKAAATAASAASLSAAASSDSSCSMAVASTAAIEGSKPHGNPCVCSTFLLEDREQGSLPVQPSIADLVNPHYCRDTSHKQPRQQRGGGTASAISCNNKLLHSQLQPTVAVMQARRSTCSRHEQALEVAGYELEGDIHVRGAPSPPIHAIALTRQSHGASATRSSLDSVHSSCPSSSQDISKHRFRCGPRPPAVHALPSPTRASNTLVQTSQGWRARLLQPHKSGASISGALQGLGGVLHVEVLPDGMARLLLSSGASIYGPADQLLQRQTGGSNNNSSSRAKEQTECSAPHSSDHASTLLALLQAMKADADCDKSFVSTARCTENVVPASAPYVCPSIPWTAVEKLRANLAAKIAVQFQQPKFTHMHSNQPTVDRQAGSARTKQHTEQHQSGASSCSASELANECEQVQHRCSSSTTSSDAGNSIGASNPHCNMPNVVQQQAAQQVASAGPSPQDPAYMLWPQYSKLQPDELRLDTALCQALRPSHTGAVAAVFTAAHRPVPVLGDLTQADVCERTRLRLHWGSEAQGHQRSALLKDAEAALEEQQLQEDADEQALEDYLDQGLCEEDAAAAVAADKAESERAIQHAALHAARDRQQQHVGQHHTMDVEDAVEDAEESEEEYTVERGHSAHANHQQPVLISQQLQAQANGAKAHDSHGPAMQQQTIVQAGNAATLQQHVPAANGIHDPTNLKAMAVVQQETNVALYGTYGGTAIQSRSSWPRESITFQQLSCNRSVRDRLLQMEHYGAMLQRDKLWHVQPIAWAAQDRELQWRAARLEQIVQEERDEQQAALEHERQEAQQAEEEEQAMLKQRQCRQQKSHKVSNSDDEEKRSAGPSKQQQELRQSECADVGTGVPHNHPSKQAGSLGNNEQHEGVQHQPQHDVQRKEQQQQEEEDKEWSNDDNGKHASEQQHPSAKPTAMCEGDGE